VSFARDITATLADLKRREHEYRNSCRAAWPRRGEPWSYAEDEHLISMLTPEERAHHHVHWKRSVELGKALGRTGSAIDSRLATLRVADEREKIRASIDARIT